MSTAVMTLGSLQQLQPAKKMVMMLSPPHDMPAQLVQPSNGACVIVSANAYPASPPHFTNLDAQAAGVANNNNAKTKNNNLNKVSRVGGGAVQKTTAGPRTSVVVTASPATTAASAAAADALRCKRRIQFSQGSDRVTFTGHQTASVARRNARERNRVKQVNNGFATLRSHIPPAIAAALQEETPVCERPTGRSAKDKEAAKKLSKVETLRMAVEYIRRLQILLNETNNENAAPGTPVSVKTESVVLPDSPTDDGFDGDYEAALALSHYSMASDPAQAAHAVPSSGASTTSSGAYQHHHHHHQQQHQQQQQHHHHHHQSHPHFVTMSPPCSDAGSAGSPTPSYVSDGSVGASSTGYAPTTFVPASTAGCRPTHLSPATPPDSTMYEPMSPEDEELLDVISCWQQSNQLF